MNDTSTSNREDEDVFAATTPLLSTRWAVLAATMLVVATACSATPAADPTGAARATSTPATLPTVVPTAAATAIGDPQNRTCPLASRAEVEDSSGISGLEISAAWLPGDVVEGTVMPTTACSWSTTAGDAWVILSSLRDAEVAGSYERARAELGEQSGPQVVTDLSGPWDAAHALGPPEGVPSSLGVSVTAVRGDVVVMTQIFGDSAAIEQAAELAALVLGRIP